MSTRSPRLAPAARRAQLLDAALDVLVEVGFSGVTIEAVAARAGVTRPVIYDQFGDLEGLMVALVDTAEASALAPLLEIVGAEPGDDVDPEEFLSEAVLAFLRAVRADPRTWRLVLAPPRGSSPQLRARIRRSRRLVADRVTALLDWGVPRRGGPPGLDHPLAARLIVAAGEDAARLMLAHPRHFTPERLSALARALVVLVPAEAPLRGGAPPVLREPPPAAVAAPPGGPAPAPRRRMPQSERREQLLDVTLALLAEDGFGALSMEAIARRAGANRAVVYRSFANLGVLLAALLHREDRRIRATLDELLPAEPGGSPARVLGDALARFLDAVRAHEHSWHLALLRPESAPPALQKLVNHRRSVLAGRLEPLVAWGVGVLGSQAELDVEVVARLLLSVGEELGRLSLDEPDYPPERLIVGLWALLDRLPA